MGVLNHVKRNHGGLLQCILDLLVPVRRIFGLFMRFHYFFIRIWRRRRWQFLTPPAILRDVQWRWTTLFRAENRLFWSGRSKLPSWPTPQPWPRLPQRHCLRRERSVGAANCSMKGSTPARILREDLSAHHCGQPVFKDHGGIEIFDLQKPFRGGFQCLLGNQSDDLAANAPTP